MMTAEATTRTHEAWCNDHHTSIEDGGEPGGWCERHVGVNGAQVTIFTPTEVGPPVLEVYAPSDTWLSPDEARTLAAELVKAAEILGRAS